ncbi:Helix-turn-helix of DDE superfamily endonuclease [Thiothrix eikelboomii]|uniref:Helix-turn-helix of DDE superfamily endonuclease n=2 Tax=Thiothrix eikelboomii TaxID=92487 RepID=A0A1T4W3Y7_9GAMM|nr:transposase family protein [Thiothrix eikelboomii]SKA71778.1 Helix-turn-helix of DDE superfamily endonuclease [Thiothrix eikelboomii]
MNYLTLKTLSPSAFKRGVGIPLPLFHELLEVLKAGELTKKKSGRPSPLSLEDQLLLTLGYWREYRTLFHLGLSYQVHESTAQRIVKRVETRLEASGVLSLAQTASREGVRGVLLDASEVPIERPQKNKRLTTVERSTPIH